MKQVIMFETSWCPYCRQARKIMDELMEHNTAYRNLDIRIIDEELHPDIAKQYNYYYVPTFYVGSKKAHEGVPSKEIIQEILDSAWV